MSKIRRILLKGTSGNEKLVIVSKYARLLVEMGKRDPDIRALAVKIVSSCAGKDYRCEAVKLHEWVRDNIRYVKDTFEVERFSTANRTIKEKAGDCDDTSILLSALLESIGHETRLILIDGDLSGRFSHVVAQVRIEGKWYWMETTKKVPFDWAPNFTITHIIDKKSAGVEDMDEDLFGNFGLGEALGEIGSLDSFISGEFGELEESILCEFGDIGDTLDDAKKALSSALDINSKVAAVEAQFNRLTQKVARMRNKKAAAVLSSKLNNLSSYLSKVKSLNSTVQGSISALKDIIDKAAQAVEEAKKKAIEAAKAAKEKAEQTARALKEKALMAAQAVKEAALRKVEQGKAAAKQIAQRANAVLVDQAARARAAAQKAAENARAYAAQQAARARAAAQQAAQQVAQRAAQVRVAAQQVAQRASQTARSAVSSIAKRFGLRGLGNLGIAPAVILGSIAVISGILGYLAAQLTSIDSQANAAESAGGNFQPQPQIPTSAAQMQESFAPMDTFTPATSQGSFIPQDSFAPMPGQTQTAIQPAQIAPMPENVQAAVDRVQVRIAQDYQNGDITRDQARDQLVQIREKAQDITAQLQPETSVNYPQQYYAPSPGQWEESPQPQYQYSDFDAYRAETESEGDTDFEPEGEFDEEFDAESLVDDEDLGNLGKSSAVQKRRAASSVARKKPQGTLTDNIVNSGKTLGLAAIAAWGIVTLAGKAIERRA